MYEEQAFFEYVPLYTESATIVHACAFLKRAMKTTFPLFSSSCSGPCGPGGKDYRMGGSLPKSEIQALP